MKKTTISILIVAILTLFACGHPVATVTPTEVVIASPVPSATATSLPGKVVLVASPNFPIDVGAVQTTISHLAETSALLFEIRESLQPADLTGDFRVVIFLAPPQNLANFLNAAPQTAFVVVTADELQPSNNLVVIHLNASRQAFIAGYITELIADDWRGAGLLPAGGSSGDAEAQAFVNGGQYWCGTCSPLHPPYVSFPIYSTRPAGSDWTSWQAAADELIANRLSTVYVSSQAISVELLGYLAAHGYKLIGTQTPAQEILGNWVATLSWDIIAPLEQNWDGIVANQGGQTYDATVQLKDVNPQWLTVGKQRLVEEVSALLQQGLLNPLDVP